MWHIRSVGRRQWIMLWDHCRRPVVQDIFSVVICLLGGDIAWASGSVLFGVRGRRGSAAVADLVLVFSRRRVMRQGCFST